MSERINYEDEEDCNTCPGGGTDACLFCSNFEEDEE